MEFQVTIPKCNQSALDSKIEKLNKRARKLGQDGITLTVVDTVVKEVRDEYSNVKRKTEYNVVDVSGETPQIKGYTFVGNIDHDGINIVHSARGQDVPVEYRERKPHCDHCNTNRLKKYSFVIRNDESGKTMQIGKTCLKDFFDQSITSYVSYYEFFERLMDELGDPDSEWYGLGSVEYVENTETVFATASTLIKEFGFVPASEWDSVTTKDQLLAQVFPTPSDYKNGIEFVKPDVEGGQDAIRWIEENDSGTEFIFNLKQIITQESIGAKLFGYIAGAVASYIREVDKLKKAKHTFVDEYVGEIKKRQDFDVTVISTRYHEGYYGTSEIISFVDSEGHSLVVFNSGAEKGLDDGEQVKIKATVTKHQEYNGVKQTTINRVKVL